MYGKPSQIHASLFNFLLVCLLGIIVFSLGVFILFQDDKSSYDSKRIFVCVLLMFFSGWMITSKSLRTLVVERFVAIPKSITLMLAVFVFSIVIANFNAAYFLRAQTDFTYFVVFSLMIAALSIVIVQYKVRVYNYFIVISYALFFCVFAGHWLVYSVDEIPTIHSVLGYANPRFINQIQVWLVIPLLYLSVIARGGRRFSYAFIPLTLNLAIIFATDARGIFISVTVASVLLALFDRTLRVRVLKTFFSALALGFLLNHVVITSLPIYLMFDNVSELSVRLTASVRLQTWKDILVYSSFWGYGGDAFVCLDDFLVERPHNSLLLILFNWGVVAAVTYLMLLLLCLKTAYQTTSRGVRVATISLLAGFAYSLVSGVLDSPLSQLMAAISIALFWAQATKYRVSSLSQHKLIKSSAPHHVVVFMCVLTITLLGYKLYERVSNDHHRGLYVEGETLWPQFWLGQTCVGEKQFELEPNGLFSKFN